MLNMSSALKKLKHRLTMPRCIIETDT